MQYPMVDMNIGEDMEVRRDVESQGGRSTYEKTKNMLATMDRRKILSESCAFILVGKSCRTGMCTKRRRK